MGINFTSILSRLHLSRQKKVGGVDRDWKVMVVTFSAFTVIAIACGLYMFWISNFSAQELSGQKKQKSEAFNQKSLDELVSRFSDRKEVFTKLQIEKPTAVDPSL